MAVGIAWGCGTAAGCSVPVFRYALEQWEAEPFLVVVFHKGELDPGSKAFLDALKASSFGAEEEEAMGRGGDAANGRRGEGATRGRGDTAQQRANVHPIAVRADKAIPKELENLWALVKSEPLPLAVALYADGRPPAWSGKPTIVNAKMLLDSPARAKIAKDIMSGASTVWVLLECGDPQKDKQARAVLAKALSEAEKVLTLPEILPEDREQNMAAGGPELKIWFPHVSVSRNDPKEQFFVRMLGGTEQGIPTDAPVAFPIFGRGRVLCAFHGEVLDVPEVEEACAFLTGMCSCEVKEMCPGTDLLFTAGWHRFPGEPFAMEAVPELVGTTKGEGAKGRRGDAATRRHGETETTGTTPAGSGGAILRNVLIVAGGGVVGVIVVSLLLWMRSRRGRG